MITYSAGNWAHNLTKKQRATLKSLTRPFLLRITGAYKTTSTDSLFALLKIPPIDIVASNIARKFHFLISGQNLFSYPNGLDSSKLDALIKLSQVSPLHRSLHISDTPISTPFDIYTDGSRLDDNVGLAFCVFKNKSFYSQQMYKLSSYNTNFQAEITAIYLAIKWAVDHQLQVNIFTDSLSSIFALKGYSSKSHFLHTIRSYIRLHLDTFSLSWVKAHDNNPENDLADYYAKAATTSGLPLDIPQPRSLIRSSFYKSIYSDWSSHWSSPTKDLRVKSFFPSVSSFSPILSPPIVQFLSGHGPFPSYLFRFHVSDDQFCPCGALGTPDHFVLDCTFSSSSRLPSSLLSLFSSSPSFWIQALLSDNVSKQLLIDSVRVAASLMLDR